MKPTEWLNRERKLDPAVLQALGVRDHEHKALGAVAAFPYRRGGETYAGKFRTIDKRFASSSGVSRGLYNEDCLSSFPNLPVVITEGEIDCLSVIQAGFDRAVSLPDGWTPEGNKTDRLLDERLKESPFVIVAGDNDEAGESLPRAVSRVLRGHDVREAQWPDGCKDPNDVLIQHGEGGLANCLNAARRIDPPGGFITSFSDLPPLDERRVLRVGYAPFDQVIALELGAMSVWTGIPGMGKSTFLTWAAEKISINEDIRVGIMAFETHPHTIRDQLSLIRTGQEFRALNEQTRASLVDTLDRRFRLVHRTFEDTAHQITWLEDNVYTLAVRDGCKLIIVDPWNELEHQPQQGESLTNYTNWALGYIRQMAEALGVHIALVAHPAKIKDGWRAPSGYDVADSAAFYNKPALGITVHQREDEDGEKWVEISNWKVRNARLYGFTRGKVACKFDQARQSYVKRVEREAQ